MTGGSRWAPVAPFMAESGSEGLGFLLGVAHRARRRAWEAELADLSLSAPQAAVLRIIGAHPGIGVRQLARTLRTDPMNARRIAETLLAAGYCEAMRDPVDARRRPLQLTPSGQKLADMVARKAGDTEKALIEALGPGPYAALVAGLHLLIQRDQDRY